MRGQGMKGKTNADAIEAKNRAKKNITEYLLNHKEGATLKEITIDFHIPAETARRYLKEMLDDGAIAIGGKDGRAIVYIYNEGTSTVAEAEKPQEMPVHDGGRTFTEVKPAINVNQGDIIWCSSRSGDGQFFRYLILVPWERKATVVGIVPEAHPMLNLNDARFVPVGTDPETGEELYADIANTCSRGYAQFGEKLMHVNADRLDELKKIMTRYYRFPQGTSDDIWAKRFEDLSHKVKNADSKIAELTDTNTELRQKLKNAYLECDEKKKAWDDAQKLCRELLDKKEVLERENETLRRANETLGEAIESTETNVDRDALLWKISLLEQELKDKNEMVVVLKQIIFKSLKGGE